MGTDGWGRPYDVGAAARAVDADVLVLQESWDPEDADEPSTAELVAAAVGGRVVVEVPLGEGYRFGPVADAGVGWGPRLTGARKAFRLDGDPRRDPRRTETDARRGRWGIALVARVPVGEVAVHSLGRLPRDAARRVALSGSVALAGGDLRLVGTHMSHLTHRSPVQFRRLRDLLPPPTVPAVLAGDMNLWGPPVLGFFPGWRRAVVGRSWPADRPHSQLDHILVTPRVRVEAARIGPMSGSDHRPAVVRLALASAPYPHAPPDPRRR